ncbi:MAG: hypothetical protein J0I47_15600 [Sphingomonas sp.]|uniref:Ig-like domain-containing protein n=1 Tax=Sphingomonas sp. TaxID=28214 RepID=UPI001AC1D748|nr:Ig-like domain-containing protein [Sphingomonas sp.]MBN8809643.1 hypothetical protein [Sphingomonas sp.]
MKCHYVWLLSSAVAGLAICGEAFAQETTSYTYDALGRLSASTISGGPNNARQTGTCFDAAGNRTRYDVATSAPASCNATPTPTPTGGNQPPVAVNDSITLPCNTTATANLTANDSDPGNNVPLTLVSVSPNATTDTIVTIISASSVSVSAAAKQSGLSFSYVVKNTMGMTATGTLSVVITGNALACAGGSG